MSCEGCKGRLSPRAQVRLQAASIAAGWVRSQDREELRDAAKTIADFALEGETFEEAADSPANNEIRARAARACLLHQPLTALVALRERDIADLEALPVRKVGELAQLIPDRLHGFTLACVETALAMHGLRLNMSGQELIEWINHGPEERPPRT